MILKVRTHGADDHRLGKPLCSQVSGEHQRSVKDRLHRRIIRHGLSVQLHRQLHLDAVAV